MTTLCVARIDYGASMSAAADLSPVVEAVRGLELRPRRWQWVSLSLCVVDAVYSIGAHYDRHVLPVVLNLITVKQDGSGTGFRRTRSGAWWGGMCCLRIDKQDCFQELINWSV